MTTTRDATPPEIAICGIACRLPGASDPAAFWRLLRDERAAITTIADDRWSVGRFLHPDRRMAGRSYTMQAGLVDAIWDFDPGFFGISPREAVQMDPQQRILLEVAAEAIESAALSPDHLAAGRTGVYVGASSLDHSQRFASDPAAIGAQFMTGNTLSILSNRISHAFDLKGPSFTVDTACSSSFYALHQAARALAAGEIDTAIVGGVNAILQPFNFVGFSRAAMLSPSGLCRAFDADADGYVRAEGAVAVVLRRLERARDAGDPVRAVLMATGVNSDGHTMGMALPSGPRQAALLAEVYGTLGIDPDHIAFVEAHGTGTPVGDPIEARAIGEVLGRQRSRPLPIGSAKSNVGHLEPASGLVGLLKAVLALEHRVLPRSLHVDRVNPAIPLDDLGLRIATEASPIAPRTDGAPWIAGVNNFGFGGANAHAVLREALERDRPAAGPPADAALPPLILTAASEASLTRLARAWSQHLAAARPDEAAGLIATAAHRAAHHRHRLIAVGANRAALASTLAAAASGADRTGVVRGIASDRPGRTAFVFSGNGAQWPGMGRDLFAAAPDFRAAFEAAAASFAAIAAPGEAAADLVALLHAPDLGARIAQSDVAQPLIFAIQAALVEALAARGLRPDAVAGHSVGEVAAAWAAGALGLDAAARLILARARAVRPLAGRGGMAAILAGVETVDALLADLGLDDALCVAGDNSPRSVTVSGESAALEALATQARARRLAMRRLEVAYPYHGTAMDEIREALLGGLAGLEATAARIDFVSTTTGGLLAGETLGPDHWWQNARAPVRFREALGALDAAGCGVFVEIGPRPVLQSYVTDTMSARARAAAVVGTMDGPGKPADIGAMAARAVAHGARIERTRFFGPERPGRPDRPAYPWDHATYRAAPTPEELDVLGHAPEHPLLGWCARPDETTWRGQVDLGTLPWLADHVVAGTTVMPATGFAEMALAAGRQILGTAALELGDFDILSPLGLDDTGMVSLRTELERETGILRIESRPTDGAGEWRLHARGTIRRAPPRTDKAEATPPLTAMGEAEAKLAWPGERLYRIMAQAGLAYGPAFRLARRVAAGGAGMSATAELDLPRDSTPDDGADGPVAAAPAHAPFVLHPASLDAAFHALFPLIGGALRDGAMPTGGATFLPVRIGRLTTRTAAADGSSRGDPRPRRAQVHLVRLTEFGAEADIVLTSDTGIEIARVEGLRLRRLRSGGRRRDTPRAWDETLVALAGPPAQGGATALPVAWAAPDAALRALGLIPAGGTAPEPDAGALIVDAAVRRIAWQTLSRLADAERGLPADGAGVISPEAGPLYARLLGALDEDGALDRHLPPAGPAVTTAAAPRGARSGREPRPAAALRRIVLAQDSPYPALGSLIDALIAEAPERASDVATLMQLDVALEHALRDGPSTRPSGIAALLPAHAPARHAIWQSLARLAGGLASDWPAGRRLALLVLGDVPVDLIDALGATPALSRLVLSDPDEQVRERLELARSNRPGICVADWQGLRGPFDAILAADVLGRGGPAGHAGLAGLLAPGGILAAIERLGDLAGDLAAGLSRQPTRRDPAAIARALSAAGLADAQHWPLDRAEVAARVIVARRAPAGATAGQDAAAGRAGTAAAEPVPHSTPPNPGASVASETPDAATAGAVVIYHPERETGDAMPLAAALGEVGWSVRLVPVGAAQGTDALPADGEIAILCPARPTAPGAAPEPRPDPRIDLCRRLLTAVPAPAGLWLLTRGGRPADRPGQPIARRRPTEAALWALGRVIANEYPGLALRQVDIDAALEPAAAAPRIAALVTAPGEERELVLDGLGLAAPRVVALPDPDVAAADARSGAEAARRLALRREGAIDTLFWEHAIRRAPGPGEVEIEVVASGLNFRDLMWAQRLLPPEALEDGFAGATLGMECAGIVTRAGEGVSLAPGTRAVAFAPAALASHVTVGADVVAALPDGLSLEAAAGLPAIFLTAQYGLVELAGLSAGESVLIHGAAGGVGLAAIQIARARGARVLATAGRPEKRALVALLGADAVFDSRSLGFAEEVRAATEGCGVDVVLNSLAGEAMARSVECLAPFGRFVELGKQDYLANTRLGLRPFRRNLSYFGVDADQLVAARPALTRSMFVDLMRGFAEGSLTAPPVQVFEPGDVADAFRLMQRAGHVGKIVIRPRRPAPSVATSDPAAPGASLAAQPAISGKGSWLVIGGLGGFGLATALWLARRGARRIWLTGRSGAAKPGCDGALAEIAALGARVEAIAVDACDREAMEMLIARIRADGSPLEGVIHAAMVIDDAPFAELEPTRFARVMRPKLEGAQVLDRLTRPLAPRHFVLYSSIATAFGNPGQAAYVAANAALEAIAVNRRADGLPALAIGWGPISDRGYLTRAEATRTLIERRLDGALLTADEALEALGALLDTPQAGPVIRYAPMRWSSLAGDLALIGTPLFERVDRTPTARGASARDFAAEIATLGDDAARAQITAALLGECARILRQPEASIDPLRPLASLGFDSLMAVDLKLSAEEALGIALPLTTLGDQMSLADLSARVLAQLRAGGTRVDEAAPEAARAAETQAAAALLKLRAQHGDAGVSAEAIDAVIARARKIGGLQ